VNFTTTSIAARFALAVPLGLAWMALAAGGCSAGDGAEPAVQESQEALGDFPSRCRTDDDCPPLGLPCRECPDGSVACPESRCEAGRCLNQVPQCKPVDPCALVLCAPGTQCEKGICVPEERVFCGGIAGIPCPGAGRCIDDPTDDCDPRAGGADCGGLCVCKGPQQPCKPGTHFVSSPRLCACVPDSGGVPCGRNVCQPGTFCCNESCGICAPKGGACTQVICEAPN
jgi:hypothetical protein